jgi:putative ABC transport system permease protein
MIIPRLALKNLLGAGIRTWLNVTVLSFAFVVIIWTQGLLEGMNKQVVQAVTEAEYGGGQYWHKNYDPYDPLTLEDAHGTIPAYFDTLIARGQAIPLLIIQGSIYPEGRFRPVIIKGIDPQQQVITLPSKFLSLDSVELPILIGNRMAQSTGLKIGDYVTVQWRDVYGAIDAQDARVVQIMSTSVPTIDNGQIWLPLEKLQNLTNMKNQATLFILNQDFTATRDISGWNFKNIDFLLEDLNEMVKTKTVSSSIFYTILLFLGLLAIFDTQVLSIFRRRKEMGTLMALGLTRWKIIQLFTLEGALNGVLAAILAALYGIPLLSYFAKTGFALPAATDSYGFAIGEKLFPTYSAGLVVGTTVLVLLITTIVSFMPTRKIARLKPTDALRGKMS